MAGPEIVPEATAPTGTGPRGDVLGRPGVDYRQLQQPTELIQPWHIPQSGREQEADALSRAFEGFGKEAQGWGSKMAAQAGKNAGADAGTQPGFNPKTGLAALTPYGEGFNAAAHVTYTSQSEVNVENAVSQAEITNPRDPGAYMQHAIAARDATLKETPPLYQPEVLTMFNRRIAAGQARINEQTVKGNQADAQAAYTDTLQPRLDAATRTASDLPAGQATATMQQFLYDDKLKRQGLVSSGAWSQERADAVGQEVNDRTVKAINAVHAQGITRGFMDTVRQGDVDAADKQLNSYLQDPANSDADKQRVWEEFEKQRQAYTTLQSQVHAADIDKMGQQLIQGTGLAPKVGADGLVHPQGAFGGQVESQIRDMYNKGWITNETRHAWMDTATRNMVTAAKTDSYNQVIDDHLHNGQGLDPADPKLVKATGPYFESHMQLQGTPYGTPSYATAATAFAHMTNIVPPTVKANVRVGLLSSDPNQVAYAARLSKQLQDANPQAALYDDHDTKVAALAGVVNDALDAGSTPQQALALGHAQVDVTPAERTARNDAYAAAVKKAGQGKPLDINTAALQKQLDSTYGSHFMFFSGSAPPASTVMRAQFDSLTRDFYAQTGDLGKAQSLAGQKLMQSWGPSTIQSAGSQHFDGRPQIVQNPIPAADVPRVKQDMLDTATANGFKGDAATLALVPMPGVRDPSRQWGLTFQDPDGYREPVMDAKTGKPVILDTQATRPSASAQAEATTAKRLAAWQAQQKQQATTDAITHSGLRVWSQPAKW